MTSCSLLEGEKRRSTARTGAWRVARRGGAAAKKCVIERSRDIQTRGSTPLRPQLATLAQTHPIMQLKSLLAVPILAASVYAAVYPNHARPRADPLGDAADAVDDAGDAISDGLNDASTAIDNGLGDASTAITDGIDHASTAVTDALDWGTTVLDNGVKVL